MSTDNHVYVGQSAVKLTLITSIDFNTYTVTSQKIKYKKPDGEEGEWTAIQSPGDEETGNIYVDFNDTTINFDLAGKWYIWAYLEFADGRKASGNPYPYYVKAEGAL
jgi:hypothetical protein